MYRWFSVASVLAVALLCATVASADVTTTGVGNLPNSVGWNPPNNNGQTDGNFQWITVDNGSGGILTLGLRAEHRLYGQVAPSGSTYYVETGSDMDPAHPSYAWWSFDWSVSSTSGLSALSALNLSITPAMGMTTTADLLPYILTSIPPYTSTTAQDAWNPGMSFVSLNPAFNMNASTSYHFNLEAVGFGGGPYSTNMDVVATPEPVEAGMLIFAVGGILSFVLRRKTAA